jgi:hypothetical protein
VAVLRSGWRNSSSWPIEAHLLGADGIAARDLDEEALDCAFEGDVELRLPAAR